MLEPLSLHIGRFHRERTEYERTLPPALLVFTPAIGGERVPDDADSDRQFRTLSHVSKPMMGVGEPVVFPVIKTRENAFGRGITVGRTGNNDVVLEDGTVSRFHAWFQRESQGGYLLTDAGSKNGTFVEGVRLLPRRACALNDGARVRFGHVELTFYLASGFTKVLARRLGP
ncbi:FHA domain-containing protein [Cystobacter fuscus]|uniref:FHA domain-containing protein n=1 Tax=Cystobacter fuscus TaxID=43 RepID=UPI002B2B66E8|nr:FHA domain-containing protein [Cystobacter fuscus]